MQNNQESPDIRLDTVAADATDIAARAVSIADRRRDGDGLDAAATLLAAVDRLIAAVITVLQAAEHHQVIADHGLTRDTWLRAIARRTGADAGMLLAAAERLADMPAVTAWFHQGILSWGAVRQIVSSTRTLTAAQRGWVDRSLSDHDGADRLDGDQVAALVDGLVARARPDLHRDRHTSALAGRWLSIQPRLDGTADIHGCLDIDTTAAALATFATMAHVGDHDDNGHADNAGDHDDGDTGGMSAGDRVRAAHRRTNVDIFRDLCRQRVTRPGTTSNTGDVTGDGDGDTDTADVDTHGDGHGSAQGAAADAAAISGGSAGRCGRCGAAPSTARPAFLVIADLASLDPDSPVGSGTARLHWATNRAPVELTPAAAQRLACDATMRAVITDGADILGVSAADPRVSATLRAAVTARDGGCRFPTCTQPADLCDVHHITPVAQDGPTCLVNLALVCTDHHHAIHDADWQVTLHEDAAMTFVRRGVTLQSQPRGRQTARPQQPPPRGRPARRRSSDPPSTAQPDAMTHPSDPVRELLPF